jgi:hypothetical protein
MGREEPGNFQPIINERGEVWIALGPGECGFSGPWAKVWITYTYLQLKRRLREREKCSIWNMIVNHKSPEHSLSQACLNFLLRYKIAKNLLRLLRNWYSLLLNLLWVAKGQQTYLQKENYPSFRVHLDKR